MGMRGFWTRPSLSPPQESLEGPVQAATITSPAAAFLRLRTAPHEFHGASIGEVYRTPPPPTPSTEYT